jgi:hypothetical protein
MSVMPAPHPLEFRQRAVQLAREGSAPVAKAYPRRRLHIVVDSYATHKHPDVQAWLAKNPRIILHFTPTSGSWLKPCHHRLGIQA